MTHGNPFRRARKVISTANSSREVSSSRGSDSRSTPIHADLQEQEHSTIQQPLQLNDEIWLTDEQGKFVRRRGRTTCADLQSMPPGTRVHIEINENGIPCNIPESTLLGSYIGVIARDLVLAPLAFPDWRNKGLEPFKKKMLAEIESKFEFPGHIRHLILKSFGVKWRNYKTSLKAEHWDSRPVEEIMEAVPEGVDPVQWCQLVTQWTRPEDQERASKNTENAKKQSCPHTMGRVSSVRRQMETAIYDRLQLWKINRIHKDGSWSSEDAKQRWVQACELLAEEGLTPEDGNIEANERVFKIIMGPEHPGRVRTQGFGVTPTRYFPQYTSSSGESSNGNNFNRFVRIESDMQCLRSEMREFMQRIEARFPIPESSEMGGNNRSSDGS